MCLEFQIPWHGSKNAFQHPWNYLSAYVFPPIHSFKTGMFKSDVSTDLPLVMAALLRSQEEWLADLALPVEEPFEVPLLWDLLVQWHVKKFHRGL